MTNQLVEINSSPQNRNKVDQKEQTLPTFHNLMKPAVIVSTYPDKKSILKIANNLVKNKIAACVNITKISSIYWWQGKIENTDEFLALFKTTQKNKLKLKSAIKKTHPYKVPEIAELDVKHINKPYLQWLVDSTRSPRQI